MAESLGDKQRRFNKEISAFMHWANSLPGYAFTDGDAARDKRTNGEYGEKKGYGSAYSVHKLRLARDYNLFYLGEYIKSSDHPAWDILHQMWEMKHGGASRIKGDANHFSFAHNGHW